MKKYILAVVCLAIIIGWSAVSHGQEAAAGLDRPQIFINGGGGFEQAYTLYQSSGLVDYMALRASLWSENNFHRAELLKKLPSVSASQLPALAGAIQQLLTENPADPAGLIMAGDLHSYLGQKETAGWYYSQAQKLAPDSEFTKLALADYYLYQRQPERASELLQNTPGPLSALRLGEARFQQGEYTSALGYLLQAKPLPPQWQAVQAKDLSKTYLALGELTAAQNLLQATTATIPVIRVLLQEYQGWAAALAGKDQEAGRIWEAGRAIDPDYKFWTGDSWWLPSSRTKIEDPPDLRNKDINSSLKLLQGQALAAGGKYSSAYQAYLAGIKADHSSLIGFLGAASMQFKAGKELAALDLCNQGLAVNPHFGPLLLKKVEILQKLGRTAEANQLKTEYNQAIPDPAAQKALEVVWFNNESNQNYLLVKGQTGGLTGFWVGTGGEAWEWYPAWGGPIHLRTAYPKAWVLPTGYGLSGEAYYIQKPSLNFKIDPGNPAAVSPAEILLQYPEKVSITVTMETQAITRVWVQDQFTEIHHLPRYLFLNQGRLNIHYQLENGYWGSQTLELPALESAEVANQPTPQYEAATAPITNHRLIEIQLSQVAGETSVENQVSIGEADGNAEWRPFQKQLQYLLSAGDGLKNITIRFGNARGIIQELKLTVELDTTPPKPESFQMLDTDGGILLKWRLDKPGLCMWRVFSSREGWRETVSKPDADGFYTGYVLPQYHIFAEIMIQDQAGNTTVITDEQLIKRLQQSNPLLFQLNQGQNAPNPNLIQIKPIGDLIPDVWSISNDFMIWSPWVEGMKEIKWRITPGAGQRLIYFKYRLPGQSLIQYQVIPVGPH